MSDIRKNVSNWLEDRLGISALKELASHKTVPVHRFSVFYYLGGMTLFFFLVQVLTGILLMLYYRPSAEEAFESVEFIMTTVPFGWLIRSIHSWSANLMVFFAFIHLVSVYFMKAYRPPRELTWVTGALIFFLLLAFGFSGYLLPWNQLAFFATKVGTDIAGVVPFIGEWTLRFLRGGDRVAGGTLSRFYGWHVAILPAIATVLIALHVVMVQLKGMSVPPTIEREPQQRRPMKFFPNFALRDLWAWIVALGVLAALAALFPWELGDKADAFAPAYENIRPEWYYVFMFQTLKLVPGGEIFHVEYEAIPILLFSLGGLVLVLVPFLDRNVTRRGSSPLFNAAGVVALIFMVAMTCWGYASLLPLWIVLVTAVLLLIMGWVTRPSDPKPDTGSNLKAAAASAMVIGALLFAVNSNGAPAPTAPAPAAAKTTPAPAAAKTPAPAAQAAVAPSPTKTSCTGCHFSDMFDAEAHAKFKGFGDDAHVLVGLSCHDCHGGNPDPKLADDMAAAMDAGYKPNPYIGKPAHDKIPEFCGRCHSSAAFMKRYNPSARVDVVSEYKTSVHGQRLATGDKNVATCTDCHGLHGMLPKANPNSRVYRTHIAETCSGCHSDAKRMASYKDPYGQPLPIDQYARWRRSVHAAAMFDKGDLTAPTCTDCHGNHGATPPGVESVALICGNCHAREAELFEKTTKRAGFLNHNTNYLTAGAKCSDCHENVSPDVVATTHKFNECVTCHENHGVTRPTIALLGPLPEAPCVFCHEGSGPLAVSEPLEKRQHYAQLRDQLFAQAAKLKLTGDTRFDWLVDRAQELPTHVILQPGGKKSLRPEFSRLFEKFRIGKTHYTYTDPVTNKEVAVSVRRCTNCHVDPTTAGAATAKQLVTSMQQVTSVSARAERVLLAAQRGGVEVRNARNELDAAVDSQIELEALVHSFSSTGAFADKQKEGMTHAAAALDAGKKSLAELTYRRKGLGAALGVILLVLSGLAIKIRDIGS